MSEEVFSNTCPKTCGLLSTAAIFITVGIVQLLAGILLLKSEYVYLLAGVDFMASVSNTIVGCLLGISASSWESKLKRMSMTNASRRNVLAGLYISVVAVNSTTAIIMIMGDGNSLLTALAETSVSISAKFVEEILACAYVISVCSPIVCIVVAIVCLSGNRLQLREDLFQTRKKRNKSELKSESYGWVFKNRPKLMSGSHPLSSLNQTSSNDCVFEENKHLVKSPLRNSSSLTNAEKPMKIWAQKRKKILEEISSPRCSVFSDNYLQFPEFTYGSYVETMLPRIKHTSLIIPHSETKSLGHSQKESKTSVSYTQNETRTTLFSPRRNLHATISRTNQVRRVDTDSLKHSNNSEKLSLNDGNRMHLTNTHQPVSRREGNPEIFQNCSKNKTSMSHLKSQKESCQDQYDFSCIQCQCEFCNESNNRLSNGSTDCREDVFDYPNDTKECNNKRTRSYTHSVSFEFEPEAFSNDPEMNLTTNPLQYSTISQFKNRIMKSFKMVGNKEQKRLSDSQNTGFKSSLTEETLFVSELNSTDSTETAMKGEIIPINIRNISSRTSSLPISADKLRNLNAEGIVNVEPENKYRNLYSEISLNDVGISTKVQEHTLKQDEVISNELKYQESITQTEENRDKLQSISSTAESAPREKVCDLNENYSQHIQDHREGLFQDKALSGRVTTEENENTESFVTETESKEGIKSRSKKQSAIRYPSILTGYPIGPDGKTDISNLIMDSDSLLGLSEEELLHRTRRIRQLRKSVEIRSKEQKSLTIHTSGED